MKSSYTDSLAHTTFECKYHIVFDFTKVDFMDSAGIGLIMGRYKKVMDKGDITIVGVRESVKRILLISGLHKIVNIYELKGQEA